MRSTTAGGFYALGTHYSSNTAVGYSALRANTVGNLNTSVGANALRLNVKGIASTAVGYRALYRAIGSTHPTLMGINDSLNTAVGAYALEDLTSGINNTGIGFASLGSLATGNHNSVLGSHAGSALTGMDSSNVLLNNLGTSGDNNTLRIGKATGPGVRELNRAFIHGIEGIEVTGAAVHVTTDGQLGVPPSSRRYKEEIQPMGDSSAALLDLIPVTFRYKPEVAGQGEGERPLQYGLIAEEVAEVFPELVVFDDEGLPETVKYHLLFDALERAAAAARRDGRATPAARGARGVVALSPSF